MANNSIEHHTKEELVKFINCYDFTQEEINLIASTLINIYTGNFDFLVDDIKEYRKKLKRKRE